MGQKTHPICFRLGQTTNWSASWFASKKEYGDLLVQDYHIRRMIQDEFKNAQVSSVEIHRYLGKTIVRVYVVRPGIAYGRGGSRRDEVGEQIRSQLSLQGELILEIYEEPNPDHRAEIIAQNIVSQIERRISYRRAMKQAIKRALQSGVKGIKVQTKGRLNGAEMARKEWYREGRIPLHTLRAKIDYAYRKAQTTTGVIGIKVWVYLGEEAPEERRPEVVAH